MRRVRGRGVKDLRIGSIRQLNQELEGGQGEVEGATSAALRLQETRLEPLRTTTHNPVTPSLPWSHS